MQAELSSAVRRQFLPFLAFVALVSVVGCNRTPGYSTHEVRKQVEPLSSSALMPFNIDDFQIVKSREDGPDGFIYELELKGKFQKTLYARIDSGVLTPHGTAAAPDAQLEFLRKMSPAKHAELQTKLNAVAPGGCIFVLVCKQAEPCLMTGKLYAKKIGKEWKCTSIEMVGSTGTRAAGHKYLSHDGKWNGVPTFDSKDRKQLHRFQTYFGGYGDRKLTSSIPDGAAIVDIDSPALAERFAAVQALLDEITQARIKVQTQREQAIGEMIQRLRKLSASAWTIDLGSSAANRKLCLEAKTGDDDSGFAAIYDRDFPACRQGYGLRIVRETGTFTDVGGMKIELACWEGRANGELPETLLGTEHADVDHRERPAAFRIFAEQDGFVLEVGGNQRPLSAAKSIDIIDRFNGAHPAILSISSDKLWQGTFTDAAGTVRPVKAVLPEGFVGTERMLLLEFAQEALVGLILHHNSTVSNGWYAYGYLAPNKDDAPLFHVGRNVVDLQHLKDGLRFENPEENRWVGYSRDGKCKYEFTSAEKLVAQPSWESLSKKTGGKYLHGVLWRGDAKNDVRVRITGDRPGTQESWEIRDAADDKKLITFQTWLPIFGRRPASADLQPNAPNKTPISAGKKIMIQAAGDEKTIYATIEGTDIREGLIISVP